MHVCSVATAPQINWISSAMLSLVFTCTKCQVDNGLGFLLFTLLTLWLWFFRVHTRTQGALRGVCKRGGAHRRKGIRAGTSFYIS